MNDQTPLSRLKVVIKSKPLRDLERANVEARDSAIRAVSGTAARAAALGAAVASLGVSASFAAQAMFDEMERPFRERRARLVFIAICVLLPQVVYFLTR